jgi:O-Antigen ligase
MDHPQLTATTYDPTPSIARRLLALLAIATLAMILAYAVGNYSFKAPLATIGLFLGIAILVNPFIGLLVVVASLPFETLGMLGDPESAGAISITKVGGLATLGAIVLDILFRRRPISMSRLAGPLSWLIVSLAFIMVCSTILHRSEESVRETVRFLTIVFFFFVTVALVNTQSRLKAVVLTWVFVGTVIAIYSLLQRQFGATVSSVDWTASAGTVVDVSEDEVGVMVRAAGTFTHPGWLALYLTITAPLTLYAIWTAPRALIRGLWLIALGLQAAAIMATFARTGYLALGLGIGTFLMRRRGGPAVLLWATLLTLATWPLWPDTVKARVESILDYTKSSSSVTRLGQQIVGWWMFTDNMATGVGPGNFEENVRTYMGRVPDRWRVEVIGAHNMYVEMLAELGVQGVVVILLIVLLGWLTTEKCRRLAPTREMALLYEALGVSLIVFAASAVLLHAQYQKEWWLLVGLIAAAGWIARDNATPDLDRGTSRHRPYRHRPYRHSAAESGTVSRPIDKR